MGLAVPDDDEDVDAHADISEEQDAEAADNLAAAEEGAELRLGSMTAKESREAVSTLAKVQNTSLLSALSV